jgi:EmrB/QacA subfamily drug resistance transporter
VLGDKLDRRRLWVLVIACVATALVILSINLPTVILPEIAGNLSASFAEQQWVVNAYALSLAALLLTAGSLSDRLGRKRVFVAGLVWFLLSSLLCGLAWGPVVLDLARAAQGVGGAVLFAGSLAILGEEFQGSERGGALGIWGAVVGAATAAGPLVGGALSETLGWRWAFHLCVVLTLPAIPLAIAYLTESSELASGGIDWIGVAALSTGVFFVVFALVGGNDRGWESPTTLGAFVLGVFCLAGYILTEKVERDPMLDLSLFRVPTFVGASLVAFSVSGAVFAMLVFAPQFFLDAEGASAFGTGLRMLPFGLAAFAASVLAGQISNRLPTRAFLGIGMVLVSLGLALMHGVDAASSWQRLAPGLAVAGAGLGLVNPLLAAAALGVVSSARGGMAAGINNTFRQLGISVGVAGLGAILQNGQAQDAAETASQGEAFVVGFNQALLVGAAIAFVGALLAVLLVRPRDFADASEDQATQGREED